jgi:hypothetical protein
MKMIEHERKDGNTLHIMKPKLTSDGFEYIPGTDSEILKNTEWFRTLHIPKSPNDPRALVGMPAAAYDLFTERGDYTPVQKTLMQMESQNPSDRFKEFYEEEQRLEQRDVNFLITNQLLINRELYRFSEKGVRR